MASFTHKNFKDDSIDAAADPEGYEIEARFARSALDAEQIGDSDFHYGPNFRAPFGHRHNVQEEAYVVIGGSGRIKVEAESSTCASGTSFAFRPTPCAASGRAGRPRDDRGRR